MRAFLGVSGFRFRDVWGRIFGAWGSGSMGLRFGLVTADHGLWQEMPSGVSHRVLYSDGRGRRRATVASTATCGVQDCSLTSQGIDSGT